MPTIFLVALRLGSAVVGSLEWYWRLGQHARRAADARTNDYIARTYSTTIWSLTRDQAKAVSDWARAQHA